MPGCSSRAARAPLAKWSRPCQPRLVLNPSAPASKELKYARVELERRFLLADVPGEVTRRVRIVDRYISGTRLRLRHLAWDDGSVFYKLTQKVPRPDGRPGLITTMYVNAGEFDTLSALPGRLLRKTRLSVPPFGVDLFDEPLSGVLIGEVEFATEDAMAAFEPPASAVVEITGDRRLTCAALAEADREEVHAVLRSYR